MGRKKKQKAEAAAAPLSLPAGPVSVRFVCAGFRHKGVEYNSANVEEAAKNGDEQALRLIAELVQRQSGVIEFVEISEEEKPGDPSAPIDPNVNDPASQNPPSENPLTGESSTNNE